MSYTHQQIEYIIAKDIDLNSAADCGDWAPGYMPVIVRAAALVVTNTLGSAGVIKIDKRPTAGDDTSRGDGDVASLTLPSGTAAGAVIYQDGIDVKVSPGEELVAQVTDACDASDTGHLIIFVEPVWETPANNTDMTATA